MVHKSRPEKNTIDRKSEAEHLNLTESIKPDAFEHISALQLPLLSLRRVTYRHGDVTLGPDWLSNGETLTNRDLVQTVGLPLAPLLRPPRAVTLHQSGGVKGPDL